MKLEDFFPHVLIDVIGCPDPTLRLQIVSAAAEFCRETLAWTESQDPMLLVNNVSDYELDVPAQAYAYTVRDVWVNGRRLSPITLHAMQGSNAGESNEPTHYNASAERGLIRVFPTPINVTGQALVTRTAFVPTMTATALPDFLGQRHMEVIASGAKARLMLIPGASWSNPQLGAYHRDLFSAGIVNARIEEAHDRVPGTIRVSPRSFGF